MDKFFESAYKQKLVIDVSSLPHLKTIIASLNDLNEQVTIYIPDTFGKLLTAAKENKKYYSFLTKLAMRWTNQIIDFDFLSKILDEKKFANVSVELATTENIDLAVYGFALENFESKDLVTNFSPPFNLLGDVIGKILGVATAQGAYILMKGNGLHRIIKNKITVLIDGINEFKQEKIQFFATHIPGIIRTSGSRWALGIIISITGFVLGGPVIGTAAFSCGMALRIVDP